MYQRMLNGVSQLHSWCFVTTTQQDVFLTGWVGTSLESQGCQKWVSDHAFEGHTVLPKRFEFEFLITQPEATHIINLVTHLFCSLQISRTQNTKSKQHFRKMYIVGLSLGHRTNSDFYTSKLKTGTYRQTEF